MGKKVEWNWHWKSWKDKLQPLSSHFTGGGLMRIPLQMCCFIIDISQRVFLSWLLIRCVSPAALIVCLPKICSIKRLLKGASSLISVWQNRVYEIFHDAQRINSIFRLGYVGNCYFSNFCFLFFFFSGAAAPWGARKLTMEIHGKFCLMKRRMKEHLTTYQRWLWRTRKKSI